jgi:D-alanine-D-alanine ligase
MSKMLHRKNILVVMGGPSEEREISLKSGRAVLSSLKSMGLNATGLELISEEPSAYFKKKLEEIIPDVCFLAIHGRFGEDGKAQELLASMGIPYTGSGPEASLMAFNKLASKEIFLKNNIPTPPYLSLKRGEAFENIGNYISYPFVIKPACQGSTIGVSIVKTKDELPDAIDIAFRYGDWILVEKFIKGRELTVGILNKIALPVIEIRPRQAIFDYNSKYHSPDTEYIVPADISPEVENEVKRLGMLSHTSLGLKDLSRIDLILGEDGIPYILEANTIPGLSERSLFPKACKAYGISFEEMCVMLVELCLKEWG